MEKERTFTYAYYKRWEIIDSEPYNMPPDCELELQKLLNPTEEVKIPSQEKYRQF